MSSPLKANIRSVWHVRFGSQAEVRTAKRHFRFTPNSDRESELSRTVMSALPPKADMCGAVADVGFGPLADIASTTPHRKDFGVLRRIYDAYHFKSMTAVERYTSAARGLEVGGHAIRVGPIET
jgi:hypothetical protein